MTGLVTNLFSTDGRQRKRKDEGKLEGTPAKRKSVGNEDGDGEVDGEAANALQNLQLANDSLEVQQNTASGLVPTSNSEYQSKGRANCICLH